MFMVPCLLLLKEVSLSIGQPNVFPQFLDVLDGSEHGYRLQDKSKSGIDGKLGLSPVYEEIGTAMTLHLLLGS